MLELPLISPLDRVLFLRAHPLFKGDPRALIAMAEHSHEVHFAAGETLIAEGEENLIFYILVEGTVANYYLGEKLYEIQPPAAVGLLPVLAGRALDSSVVAMEETTALAMEVDAFLQILEDHFGLVLSATGGLARILGDEEERAGIGPGLPDLPDSLSGTVKADLDLVDRLSLVRRHRLFSGANLGLLAELFRGDIVRHFEAGDVLCRAGEAPDVFDVVVDGVVRMEDEAGERRGYVDAVGVVGWRDIFTWQPRTWSGIACGPVRTLRVPAALYIDVLEDHFDHTLAVVGQLAQRCIQVFSRRGV